MVACAMKSNDFDQEDFVMLTLNNLMNSKSTADADDKWAKADRDVSIGYLVNLIKNK